MLISCLPAPLTSLIAPGFIRCQGNYSFAGETNTTEIHQNLGGDRLIHGAEENVATAQMVSNLRLKLVYNPTMQSRHERRKKLGKRWRTLPSSTVWAAPVNPGARRHSFVSQPLLDE